MESVKELHTRIARLESQNDYLLSEILYVDELLKNAGFKYGIASIKSAIESVAASESEV